MLNPLWLHTFKTLIETGHFTQTAKKLHMTQPGVSQHVKKLESACGHSLIRRENKSFELTEQGRMVYEYALKTARDEADLIECLSFDNPTAGKCILSCSGSLVLSLYPHLLAMQQHSPELQIYLEAAPNHKILHDIQAGITDLGVVTYMPNSSFFQSELIGEDALCLVLPRCYQGQPLTAEILCRCGLIDHPDAMHYLTVFLDMCGEPELAEINPEMLLKSGYINQLNQILLPVAKGLGFTVLPQSAVENFPGKDEIYVVSTRKPVLETLYLVHLRNRNLPRRYQTIYELFSRILATEE
ncbi:Hydrogen peroxide-inducible genes activator [Vibrio aerogenes CECT 7868]|uniref:Hydrogen peroxide-inducible genes activator n=1 Tax=Vibrio aerogenes CECT 7868 TaxID=1216006 RepID=A0A1M6EG74_9VIBR|nr:LysR family transcriptional regulator [Vibrio aerogenes]SHI84298.1 Hydrogen peroxide-inducible genes activator [Vibrio aerogenes CECT 7868]